METLLSADGTPQSGPAAIKDTTSAGFMADVVEASMEVPVIVDFWAPWCGPCKQMTPIIEKAVRDARGAVRMVKLNIDESPEIAQQMRIQSIPAVFAFKDGRPVDGFVGAVPESQIKQFIDRLAKLGGGVPRSPIDDALEQAAAALEAGDANAAGALYQQIMQHEPGNLAAVGGMVTALVHVGQLDEARAVLDGVVAEDAGKPEIVRARAALELAEQAGDVGDLDRLRQAVEASPEDLQARYDLALALQGAGDRDGAADALLEVMRRNRGWNEDAARKQLVRFFEAWGPTDPLTLSTRRRLSSLLFS